MKTKTVVNNRSQNAQIASVFFILFIGALLLFILLYQDELGFNGKNAPLHPEVKEQIDQAKSLQKQGKLIDSAVIFERYALQGYPEAMFYLAKAYSKGWGVKPDLDKARYYFISAVKYNFRYRGETAYQLGKLYQKSKGPNCNSLAVAWFEKSLDWFFVKASTELAVHYEQGVGVKQDISRAVNYYRIAVQAELTNAHLKYARILHKGLYGIPADPIYASQLTKFAVNKLELAVKKGKSSPAKTLGRLYRDGVLVDQNTEQAIYWLKLAHQLGNAGAMFDLGNLLLFLDEKVYEQEAIGYLKDAVKLGHGGAATALGRLHLNEKYNLKPSEASDWFVLGVKAKHGGSIQELAKIYYEGILKIRDIKYALLLLKKGAELGHSGSIRLLKKYQKALPN